MPMPARSSMMPAAMAIGAVLHDFFSGLNFLTPYLIFVMLLMPFCGCDPRKIRLGKLHFTLLGLQLVVSAAAYLLLGLFNEVLAQGAMICILAPTATSAVVVGAMLGADVEIMIGYSMLINSTVAVCAPVMFSAIGAGAQTAFLPLLGSILSRVAPLLALPLATAMLLRVFTPAAADKISSMRQWSFYLWLLALAIVTGRTVNFMSRQSSQALGTELLLAAAALIICAGQFIAGRAIGRRYGQTVAAGQSLGQKNTILAIWMAQSYLNPLSSVAPAAYVLWQNLINSFQLWNKDRGRR